MLSLMLITISTAPSMLLVAQVCIWILKGDIKRDQFALRPLFATDE